MRGWGLEIKGGRGEVGVGEGVPCFEWRERV